jgi:hypothetical protein
MRKGGLDTAMPRADPGGVTLPERARRSGPAWVSAFDSDSEADSELDFDVDSELVFDS